MIIPMHKAGTTIPTITLCSCSITGSREEKKKEGEVGEKKII